MAVSPPFSIAETVPATTDLISNFPGQENPFRDTVESWLNLLSDPATGLLRNTAITIPLILTDASAVTFLQLKSTDAGAAAKPVFELFRDSASPANSDILGGIYWYGRDSAANQQFYSSIETSIGEVTSGNEGGTMIFKVPVAGVTTTRLTLGLGGATINGVLTYAGAIAGLTGTGALDSGSITSGFGSINIGTDALTAGAASFTSMTSSGAVSGTTGTFSAGVSGTTGTFSSNVTVTGNVTASNGFQATAGVFGNGGAGTLVFRSNGIGSSTNQMTYTSAGTLTAAGDITAFSDKRLKKSISPLNHIWANDMVREVVPVTYIRKSTDTRSIGFIAQDVQAYAPEVVHENEHGILSLAYPNMVAILWAVVQDLQAKVAALEAK